MTDALPQARERKTARRASAPGGPGLFVTDLEVMRMTGLPDDEARMAIVEHDRRHHETGFPQKIKQWGNRRYRKAVEAWFEAKYGYKMPVPQPLRRAS